MNPYFQPSAEDSIARGDREPVFAEPATCTMMCGATRDLLLLGGDPWCPECTVKALPEIGADYLDRAVSIAVVESLGELAIRALVAKVAAQMDAEALQGGGDPCAPSVVEDAETGPVTDAPGGRYEGAMLSAFWGMARR